MSIVKRSVVTSSLVCLLFAPWACVAEHSRPPAVVVGYCSGCHGVDGKSQLPYVPRLAGLSAEYLSRKLASFKAAESLPVDETFHRIAHFGDVRQHDGFTREASAHMVGPAHALSEKDLRAAASWYAAQPPIPGRSRKGKAVLDEGKSLYTGGIQSRGLQACQTCHGAEGQGSRNVPRIAGQNAAYVASQLALFKTGEQRDSPMTDIARRLENNQVQAVAAYLQSR